MRTLILALTAGTVIGAGGITPLRAHAASTPGTSISRQIVKLDAMGGSKVVATAVFVYDHKTNLTTATLTASRLQPRTVHPAAVHLGRCTAFQGPIVHAFPALHADKKGSATIAMHFRGPISHDKWYVAIYRGPTLKSQGGTKFVACGNIS